MVIKLRLLGSVRKDECAFGSQKKQQFQGPEGHRPPGCLLDKLRMAELKPECCVLRRGVGVGGVCAFLPLGSLRGGCGGRCRGVGERCPGSQQVALLLEGICNMRS